METTASRIAAWLIIASMFLTSADVLGRYLFNNPITTVYEIVQIMLLGIVYLSIAYVLSLRGHPKVDIITSWLPWRAQLALDIFGYTLGLLMMAVVTWQCGLRAWHSWVVGDYTMGLVFIPLWPGKSMLPIGIGLLCIRLILIIIEDSTHLLRGIPPMERVKHLD